MGSCSLSWLGQVNLSCTVRFCHSSICPGYLSKTWLVSLVVFLLCGCHVLTREVHQSSLRQLICPAQDHFIVLTLYLTFVLSLTQVFFFLSLYVMLSILPSIFVRVRVLHHVMSYIAGRCHAGFTTHQTSTM